MSVASSYSEDSAQVRAEGVPLSHVSIELGHLYKEDYDLDDDALVAQFRRVWSWAEVLGQTVAAELGGGKARISTCFLVDEYSGKLDAPSRLIPRLQQLCRRAGMRIDYLGRESACAGFDGLDLAGLVAARLVDEPPPGTDGSRPPSSVTGWLCNGERTAVPTIAMSGPSVWQPPTESAESPHSVFIDVELWSVLDDRRHWSCSFLAAIWQLLRLGLVRDHGRAIVKPGTLPKTLPDSWEELPAVVQINGRAAPFSGYRTYSIMDNRFMKVEHAVRTILGASSLSQAVTDQLDTRAAAEKLQVPNQVADRVGYVFLPPPLRA